MAYICRAYEFNHMSPPERHENFVFYLMQDEIFMAFKSYFTALEDLNRANGKRKYLFVAQNIYASTI